jgi:hypothetical protein
MLCDDLFKENNDLKEINLRKFNTDSIENFFAWIRNNCGNFAILLEKNKKFYLFEFLGSNTHPTAYETGCGFGKYMSNLSTDVGKIVSNRNCQPDSEIHLPLSSNESSKLNAHAKATFINEDEWDDIYIESNFQPENLDLPTIR